MRLNWADGDYWKTAYQQGHINEYLSIIINDERKREREKQKRWNFCCERMIKNSKMTKCRK